MSHDHSRRDLRSNVGAEKNSSRGVGNGKRTEDGENFIPCRSHNLVITHVVLEAPVPPASFYNGNAKKQIGLVLTRHRDQKLITDAKVVQYEAARDIGNRFA